MKTAIERSATLATVALLLTLSAGAPAADDAVVRYADELDTCVSALNERLDLAGVHRIRHVVTKLDTNGIGYALTLRTSTYADEAEKQYSAYCEVTGTHRPTRLRVKELAS